MRVSFWRSLMLLLVLFLLSAATASPQAQAEGETKPTPAPDGSEVSELTLTPAQLAGLTRAPSTVLTPLGVGKSFEAEPNGTPATANSIAGDSAVVEGNIFPNADVDYYAFTAQAGDKLYAAVMTSFSATGSVDSQLRVFDTDGTTLIEFDNDDGTFGTTASSIAGATLASGGTYYLEVRHTSATAQIRPYYLYFRLQRGAPTAEVEANDTPATANALPVNGWVSGTRNPALATEQDWYSFSANAGDTVFLSLDLDPERDNVQWDGRLGMALFGDANNQILVVNDVSTGSVANPLSEAFFMTVKDTGTYYAFVDSTSAAVGGPTATYHLSVSIFPSADEGVNCTTYTSTNVPQTIGPGAGLVSSTITVPGNPRIADIDVSIQLNHTFMNQIDAHLRSPAGGNNGLFTDIGAVAAGGQIQMDLTLDDEAAIPFAFTVLRPMILKPELNYRLGWFDGENAGGVWTLDLYDDIADANGGTLTGWSIRICEPEALLACPVGTIATTVYSSDFESNDGGFTHNGTADEWERGLPATVATTTTNPLAAFLTCNSGTNCWKTDLDNTYDSSSNQNLLSPAINLTTAGLVGPVYLTWAQKYQIESASFDHAYVDVQLAGGGSPSRQWEWLGATMANAPGNPLVNIGESAGWGVYTRDISSRLGQNIEVLFHLDSDTTVNLGGLAIDDVAVTACLTPPDTDGDGINDLLECPAPGDYTNPPSCANADGAGAVDMLDPLTICGLGAVATGQDWDFATTHPITLSVQTRGTLECVQISETAGVHPQGTTNGAAVTNNWWYTIHGYNMARVVDAPNGSFSATLTMPTSFSTGVDSKLCRHTAGPGAGWDCAGGASGADAVQRSGITAFSEWSAGQAVGPTAVTLQGVETAAPRVVWVLLAAVVLVWFTLWRLAPVAKQR